MGPKFEPGDRVRVRVGSPPGHYRTPAYIQGKVGEVEAGRQKNKQGSQKKHSKVFLELGEVLDVDQPLVGAAWVSWRS